ncbi:hypothetical protein CPB83DRAFT_756487 [Crepidotus variabilis]|uniref:F-box domain-containing protein n=1 Tax=Crepidotus variabilis TaxID=179855 RepID=A0A9P6ES43_9AGAR|nr:hypothetical protein CPB83DRAFT_756487 [Crepidotus variabilis]
MLPTELIDNICVYLSPNDLASSARVSSTFRHVAQRVLYRHVALDSFSRNLSCVLTLAHSPQLARNVRSFAIRLNQFSGHLNAFYRSLAVALSNMSELSSLEVFTDQAASWVMRNDQIYPRLRRLACSFHLDPNVVHFLNKTHNVVELEVESIPPSSQKADIHLRSEALPRLAQFTGSSHAAQIIVPGRPIEHIHLNSGDLTEEVAENLAKSTAPILVLGAATSSHSVSLIGTLTRCMEHLVHLRIVTTYNFSDAPDATYFANIADALTSLPDLQTCEIWGLHWISSKKSFYDESRVWQSEGFNTNNLMADGNFLDNISDLIFPY